MCLESINHLMSPEFAWLGLAVIALLLAALGLPAGLDFLRRRPGSRADHGFTCPCYAPPNVPPPENPKQ
jgi:hypothetical protein